MFNVEDYVYDLIADTILMLLVDGHFMDSPYLSVHYVFRMP